MTLYTIDKEMLQDTKSLFSYLGKSDLTLWVSTPSFAEICIQSKSFAADLMPSVSEFLFCGEVLTHKLSDGLAERFPQAKVINTYGPTEATVLVSAVEVTEKMRVDNRSIPIGFPLDEVELRLVDEQGVSVQEDEAFGELLIISDSVGPGYYQRPDLTEERFFVDEQNGKRGYRTGDICFRKKGLYYYHGRADNQLKLGGFRVEIEDIENNLARVENISRAAVVPVWAGEKVQYLAAFVLLSGPDGLSPLRRSIALKRKAGETLPEYMVPRKIIAVDSFPLNVNGKVDKKALAGSLQAAVQ